MRGQLTVGDVSIQVGYFDKDEVRICNGGFVWEGSSDDLWELVRGKSRHIFEDMVRP